ncbi:helix-turn-helix transcriptional regulator [Amycolatopsis regifaucium]|uniref:Helix-turn-helix transcriptional regulator n=1 Tax=Amycolatopsis regifaucium TaxID=546365 RepID=A0A154MX22_9PSEU|nr:response regulator transcription factor [Amycolatopsis regifaucium]KZB88009.1 helix-turn-helix transcriptional regulator [Amycolatopsis regifaucium]OKA04488.1 helix-turn-helix transcriptional regulator [Amycolatopsis regifaucium]SFH50287.1 DNA-binding response regulator, NarL/FixJ family, contains REC and HTH domains [Amycolatopsis regifaucium]
MDAVKVLVQASDEFTEAGVKTMLGVSEQLQVLTGGTTERPDVILAVVDGVVGSSTFAFLRQFQGTGVTSAPRAVVVADRFRAEDLLVAVECGVTALLSRNEIKEGTLASAVLAVGRGAALMPYRLQGILLDQLTQLRFQVLAPAGLTLFGFETRERDVLQLIAEGYQTDEIAKKLTYSEGTVKNVLYGLMSRLRLNTRSQAVAYAMRAGLI